ncbi:MAG TPA: GGDEF domain-containing protein [Steroidobacteraceae bacterium]|nr:GGDEF domain-containing protein [Steroidobacteraceae bacterium]
MFAAVQTGRGEILIVPGVVPTPALYPSDMLTLTQRHTPMPGSGKLGRPAAFPQRVHAPIPETLTEAIDILRIIEAQLELALSARACLKAENTRLMQALEAASRRAVAAQRVAHHDHLTGLPNRLFLIGRLQKAIIAAGQKHRQLALLFIDLDGFKVVNDDHGHRVADQLLAVVASRISACVRFDDIACRYGGDEFVALLANFRDASIAAGVVQKVRDHIAEGYTIAGHEIRITASIGLAVFPEHGVTYDALVNHADAAMYRDKEIRRRHGATYIPTQ